jgi:hypothetical protein
MVARRLGVLARVRQRLEEGLAARRLEGRGRPLAALTFACGCVLVVAAEALRTELVPERGRYQYAALLEPLKRDLTALGVGAGDVLGYQDDFMHAPGGNQRYLHLTRLFLAPVRLALSSEPEWLLSVCVERPLSVERTEFELVKEHVGLQLYRRRRAGEER